MGSPAGSFKRGPPQVQPHPFLLYEASRGLKNQQSSDATDRGAGDASAGSGQANGVDHLVRLLPNRSSFCAIADVLLAAYPAMTQRQPGGVAILLQAVSV